MSKHTEQEFYINLVKFLGETLGPKYEIVYHVISKRGAYIAAIENSHISGRTLNSPLTAFASQLIKDKVYLEKDFISNYKASVADRRIVNGATFFIKNTFNELTGLLCINYDNTEVKQALETLVKLERLQGLLLTNDTKPKAAAEKGHNSDAIIEDLSQSVDELIENVLGFQSSNNLSPQQKEEYIKELYVNGIFNIKGAIPKIAKKLNISEPSVYRYLQKIKKTS